MFTQNPEDSITPAQRSIAGQLIRQKLDGVGLAEIADYINDMNQSSSTIFDGNEPAVASTRRRARPFSPVQTAPVTDDGATEAVDLLALTRQLDVETMKQKMQNSYLYEQMVNNMGLV